MDFASMHTVPLTFGHDADVNEPVEYHDISTAGLAERCAGVATEWGTDKVAAQVEPSTLYRDADAHPLVLMLMVLDRYGSEAAEWDAEVLRATMLRDAYQVSGANWAKIMAVRTLLMSPSPWRQWEVFHWVARALAGHAPNFTYLEEPVLGHLMVAADVLAVCDPKRETQTEVDKFIAAAFKHEGHVYAPRPLDFAQRELEDPQLECGACHALFADNNDTKCVSCGAAQLKKIPFAWATLRDVCRVQFESRRDQPLERAVDGLGQDGAGNLVYDLLVHWDYAKRVRKNLLAQLRTLAK